MCVDMGGGFHTFGKRGVHRGSRKGGFTGGFTKRGVHVNPVNPPGYGPVKSKQLESNITIQK